MASERQQTKEMAMAMAKGEAETDRVRKRN